MAELSRLEIRLSESTAPSNPRQLQIESMAATWKGQLNIVPAKNELSDRRSRTGLLATIYLFASTKLHYLQSASGAAGVAPAVHSLSGPTGSIANTVATVWQNCENDNKPGHWARRFFGRVEEGWGFSIVVCRRMCGTERHVWIDPQVLCPERIQIHVGGQQLVDAARLSALCAEIAEELQARPTPAAEHVFFDIHVCSQRDPNRQNVSMLRDRPFPLQPDDGIRFSFALGRAGFVYAVWINREGVACPLYPWIKSRWTRMNDQPSLLSGELPGKGRMWPLAPPHGVETAVFGVRYERPMVAADSKLLQERLQLPSVDRLTDPSQWVHNQFTKSTESSLARGILPEPIDVLEPDYRPHLALYENLGPFFDVLICTSFTSTDRQSSAHFPLGPSY